jgi:hypothetical protein
VKLPNWTDILVAGVIITVSFAPLIPSQGGEALPAPGGYSCGCGQYFVSYSGPNFGGDKPHIYTNYQGNQIDVLEVSDKESTIDGLNISSAFTEAQSVTAGALRVEYLSSGLNFNKTVSLSGSALSVGYTFSKSVNANLTLWRWYFASIGPFDRPVDRELGPLGSVSYTLLEAGAVFNATVSATPTPVDVRISGVPGAGLNKITLVLTASSVSLSIRLDSVRPLVGAEVPNVGSSTVAYPIIGTSSAAIYLVLRRRIAGRVQ